MDEKFRIDSVKQQQIKEALTMAKCYCVEHSPIQDTWLRDELERKYKILEELEETIGKSFVVGDFS